MSRHAYQLWGASYIDEAVYQCSEEPMASLEVTTFDFLSYFDTYSNDMLELHVT